MSNGTSIEWTDASWNPVVGCTPVSPGCLNCYAATFAARGMHKSYVGLTVRRRDKLRDGEKARTRAVFNGTVRCLPEKLDAPLHWRKPRRVFVNSMSDLFHEAVPFSFVDEVFAVMFLCPQHTFQVLTKRPDRMAEYTSDPGRLSSIAQAVANRAGEASMRTTLPLPNVWLGTSCENQKCADERLPHLLRCPAAVRFLSIEPQVDAIEYRDEWAEGLGWMIGGGESGHGSHPYAVGWAREGIKFAARHGIPWFQKQLGAKPVGGSGPIDLADPKGGDMSEWPEDLRVREFPGGAA